MSLEDICISLEIAKKLADAGIKIDSVHFWVQYASTHKWYLRQPKQYQYPPDMIENEIAGPTADEFELPNCITNAGDVYHFIHIKTYVDAHRIYYTTLPFNPFIEDQEEINKRVIMNEQSFKLCEVFAKTAMWLKKEGYLDGRKSNA